MPYTIEDADNFKAILTDPNGPWAKADPRLRNKAIADHDARVADLAAKGQLAPTPTPLEQPRDRGAEMLEVASGALSQLHPNQLVMMEERAAKVAHFAKEKDRTPEERQAERGRRMVKGEAQFIDDRTSYERMVDETVRALSFTDEYRIRTSGQERGVDDPQRTADRSYFNVLVTEASAYLKAHPEIKLTIAQAKADVSTLRSLAAAARVAKK